MNDTSAAQRRNVVFSVVLTFAAYFSVFLSTCLKHGRRHVVYVSTHGEQRYQDSAPFNRAGSSHTHPPTPPDIIRLRPFTDGGKENESSSHLMTLKVG